LIQEIQQRFGEKLKRKKNILPSNLVLFFMASLLFLITVIICFGFTIFFMDDWRLSTSCLVYSTHYGDNSTFIVDAKVKHISPIQPKILEIRDGIDKNKVDGEIFSDFEDNCWLTVIYGEDGKYIDKFTKKSKKHEAERYSAYLITLYVFGFIACGLFLLSVLTYALFHKKAEKM